MKITISIIFFLLQSALFSQYDSSRYYHDLLNNKKAASILEKRLKQNKYPSKFEKALDTYNLSCAYSILNSTAKSIELLNKVRQLDSSYYKMIFTDRDFYNISNTSEWYKFTSECRSQNKINMSDSLYYNLTNIAIRDQALYTEINFYEKKYGSKSSKVLKYWLLKDSLNKLNLTLVNRYISMGVNVLSDSVAGKVFSNKCFLVIQHSNYETMEKYLPIIKSLYERKQTEGENYALLFDRVSLHKNKGVQYYGTQVNPETNYLYPIKDEKTVDIRREELNMISIKEYLLRMNIIYDPKRKK